MNHRKKKGQGRRKTEGKRNKNMWKVRERE
jgi:hypothetical protein